MGTLQNIVVKGFKPLLHGLNILDDDDQYYIYSYTGRTFEVWSKL